MDEAAKEEPLVNVVLDTQAFKFPVDDPYILHKTTKREMYDNSRARTNCQWHCDKNEPFDVILWNSNQEITETSITNIAIQFTKDGKRVWKTPKVSCGLLPGVFRTHLLTQNPNIVEDVIKIDDLKHAQKVHGFYLIDKDMFYLHLIFMTFTERISHHLLQFGQKSLPSAIIDNMRLGCTFFSRNNPSAL